MDSHKRRRTDDLSESNGSDTLPPAVPASRSQKFWFDDGTVVLHADGDCQFRVHKGVLGARSPFFKDMFSMSQPSDETLVEGCSVVRVHDSSQDWERFLQMVYHPLSISEDILDSFTKPFDFIISILRIAKKYEFEDVRDFALGYLKKHVPGQSSTPWTAPVPQKILAEILDLVEAAIQFGMESIMPGLCYVCYFNVPMTTIFYGAEGTDREPKPFPVEFQKTLLRNASRTRKCFLKNLFHLFNSSPKCGTSKCIVVYRFLRYYMAESELINIAPDKLMAMDLPLEDSNRFCDECAARYSHLVSQASERFWGRFPEELGFASWGDLRDFTH